MTNPIKVYLDTNMILDMFINHARAMKKKDTVLVPKKYEFMLSNKENVIFVTSFITEAEVARELSSAFGLKEEEISTLWDNFMKSLECTYVNAFTFDKSIAKIAARSPMKIRTLFNIMHLVIAIGEGCYFVSGDKDLVKKIRLMGFYEKAIDYKQLRQLLEGGI